MSSCPRAMRRTPSAIGSSLASSNFRARLRRVARTLPAAAAAPAAASAPVAASARGSGLFARRAIGLGEVLVLVAGVVGDLAAEPCRRRERLRALLVRKLGLDDHQPVVVSPVSIELERQAVRPADQVAALAHAPAGRQRPEALEPIGWDRELLLRA